MLVFILATSRSLFLNKKILILLGYFYYLK
jgi:hypothetical protein